MRKKCNILAAWAFVLALADFALSYVCFHYLTDSGFTTIWQPEAGKPFVTDLLGNLGVLLLFAAIMSLLVGKIFFRDK